MKANQPTSTLFFRISQQTMPSRGWHRDASTPTFSVGIGGPTSAGKTLLAQLLQIVLRDAIWAARRDVGSDAFIDTANTTAKVVRQDDFFIPATEQKWPLIPIPVPPISNARDTAEKSAGVDRDCIECVRFDALEKELRHTVTGACMWNKMPQHVPSPYTPYQTCIASAIDVVKNQLVASHRRRSEQPAQNRSLFIKSHHHAAPRLSCQFQIIKGNLVLARLPTEHLTVLPSDKDPETRGFVLATRAAQERVRDALDVRLFLPVSKETAARRRFSRPIYQDLSAANPHGRVKAQHWRQEWYFSHVW